MSSTLTAVRSQRSLAPWTRAFAAELASLLFQYLATIYTTSSLLRNSKTPSLPRTKNLSSCFISHCTISGSQITPIDLARKSPNDLDMARPGASYDCSQTLVGPTGLSCWSFRQCIRPPMDSMRYFYCGRSGLWSLEIGIGVQWSLLKSLPIRARESPTFPQVSCWAVAQTAIIVLPLLNPSNFCL